MDRSTRDVKAARATRVRRALTLAIAGGWTLAMLVLFWSPPPPAPQWSGDWLDEAIHASAFFGFAIVWWIAGLRTRAIAIFGGVLAIATELVQPLLPWARSAELGDVLADAGGLAIGLCGLAWLRRWRS